MAETDSLSQYLAEITDDNEYKSLNITQEQELFKSLEGGNSRARDKIIKSNLRAVIAIAKKYSGSKIDLSELIAEGNLALFAALENFDYNLGYKFMTYAQYWVHHYVRQYVIIEQKRRPDNVALEGLELVMPAPKSEQLVQQAANDFKEAIDKMMKEAGLTLAEFIAVRLFFGLSTWGSVSLQDIADALHVTLARAQSLKSNAIRKIREYSNDVYILTD